MGSSAIMITGLATDRVVSAEELDALIEAHDAVPVAVLLDLTAIAPDATRVHVTSGDGSYSASIPLSDVRRGGVITTEPDGNRLRVRDGTTLCWNVKDVGELRLTATKEPDSVPERPPH